MGRADTASPVAPGNGKGGITPRTSLHTGHASGQFRRESTPTCRSGDDRPETGYSEGSDNDGERGQ